MLHRVWLLSYYQTSFFKTILLLTYSLKLFKKRWTQLQYKVVTQPIQPSVECSGHHFHEKSDKNSLVFIFLSASSSEATFCLFIKINRDTSFGSS